MEPLSAAFTAAATLLAGGALESAGGDAWAAARDRLADWLRLEQSQRDDALDKAVSKAKAEFRRSYRGPLPAEQLLAVLERGTPEGQRFRQALAEELLLSARPDLGRLADCYRRQVAYLSILRREATPNWTELEPALHALFDLIERELAKEDKLRPRLLDRAELQMLDVARAGARSAEEQAATLRRIEALLSDLVGLPQISAASGDALPPSVVIGQYTHIIAPITALDLAELYRSYCAFLSASFGTLDFRGIVQMQNVVRLRLEDVYVPLRAAAPLPDVELHPRGPYTDPTQDERSLHTLVRDQPLLVLLGEPGAGKSTLARMVMLELAEGRGGASFGLGDELMPIFFPVAAFAEVRGDAGSRDLAPLDYLRAYFCGQSQPDYTPLFERALLAGRALVLFDGLDEVRDDRLEIMRCLEKFIDRWDGPGNRFLATSRIAGYDDAPLDDTRFRRATVQPFDDAEIGQFSERWSLAFERAGAPQADPALRGRADTRARELRAAVFANANVTALARNPLLMTILALIHNQGTRLPDRRVDLYRLCVEALAETWNRARNLAGREFAVYLGDEKLDERFVVNLLGPAALWVHAENPGGLVERRELERQLAATLMANDGLTRGKADRLAADFLKLVHHETGLLQERGHQRYGFVHLTFEEYLAARALVDSAAVADTDAEIHRRATDPGWREVLRLALATVPQKEAQRLLLHLLDAPTDASSHGRPAILAGECLIDIGRSGATRRPWDAVVNALLALLSDPAAPVATRVEAGSVLGQLGDPRLLDPQRGEAAGLGGYPAVAPYWCAIAAGPFWSGDDRIREARADEEHPPRFDPAHLERVVLAQPIKIARYPVTNAEYARFLAANGPDGYDPAKPWWTEAGREFLRLKDHRQPRRWDDLRFNAPSQPVVGVAWYEAAAYCRWLSAEGHGCGWLPPNEEIRLPTWHEWERAARHTDQRPFPWGNTSPTALHANYAAAGVGAPSPVGCFGSGRAVCGADDLIGNVVEWTASPWRRGAHGQKDFTRKDLVMLSLSYFGSRTNILNCGARDWDDPGNWSFIWGFRVVQSLVLTE